MEEKKKTDCKILHVQIVDGTQADIYEIGEAMKEFKKSLPFRMEALITNDKVKLQDVDTLIKELVALKKQLTTEERFKK